jgi:hypothetical protein
LQLHESTLGQRCAEKVDNKLLPVTNTEEGHNPRWHNHSRRWGIELQHSDYLTSTRHPATIASITFTPVATANYTDWIAQPEEHRGTTTTSSTVSSSGSATKCSAKTTAPNHELQHRGRKDDLIAVLKLGSIDHEWWVAA